MTNATAGLDKETIEIIKSTVPVLEEHGVTITTRFYQLMLEDHPELKNIFNMTNQRDGSQPRALANSVYAAAANIDQLEEILPHVKQVAHKHTSLNVKAEHYPIVGKYLLIAIKDVLGDAATDDIIDAWGKAYNVIADVFISVENEMYEQRQNVAGGWADFRDFTVVKKVKESDVITSFYLKPADGLPIATYEPGQYITVNVQPENSRYEHLRQYSLSVAPNGDYYRISVKREEGNENPDGEVSNYLHNHVEEGAILPISVPSGEFVLDENVQKPLVLISGGVGLTPLMSMLETAIEKQPEREVIFIHAAKSYDQHAMREKVASLAESHEQVTNYIVYSDYQGSANYDKAGHIDQDWLNSVVPTKDASYYFCGPTGFMRAMYQSLKGMNVSDEDIHFEVFGPAEDITA